MSTRVESGDVRAAEFLRSSFVGEKLGTISYQSGQFVDPCACQLQSFIQPPKIERALLKSSWVNMNKANGLSRSANKFAMDVTTLKIFPHCLSLSKDIKHPLHLLPNRNQMQKIYNTTTLWKLGCRCLELGRHLH